ncbi:MAG: DUF3365 domain-containing protein [Sphingomonadales bacterium]|nr:DUF3365 domain-containing protein [Sphingomonadales bacterium]
MMRVFISSLLIATSTVAMAEPTQVDDKMKEARIVTKAFGADMKKALKSAVAKDGMVGAIETCGQISPEVAHEHSKNGWHVARTSHRVRNMANAPDEWESEVLVNFAMRNEAGESFAKMDFGEWVGGEYRYMKAMGTQPFCMSCHGSNIGQAVKAKINANYPDDHATAFKVGDLRGAFTLRWTAE